MFNPTHRNRFFLLVLFFTVCLSLGLVIVSAQESEEPASEAIEYTITMSEFQFMVEGLEANAALELETDTLYTLHFVHAGVLEHEVLIGQNPIEIGEGMHLDFEHNLLDDIEVEVTGMMNEEDFAIGVAGLIEFELHPSQALSLTFTLPEDKIGDWELACFVFVNPEATDEEPSPTHYDAMMRLPITVVAAQE